MRPHDQPQSLPAPGIRFRRGVRSVALWAFGLATTMMLIGLWGRVVAEDSSVLAGSAEAVIGSDVVADRMFDWVGDGLADALRVPPEDVRIAIDELRDRPEVDGALSALVEQMVEALLAPPSSEIVVDVGDALAPLVPAVVAELEGRGIDIDGEEVDAAISSLDAVELATDDVAPVAAVVREARGLLSVVIVFAALVMLVSGSVAAGAAEDRLGQLRSLAVRVALSAMSFAVIFRLGAWARDPVGGGSPILDGGAVMLGSNLHVFLLIGAGSAVLAVAAAVVGRRVRRVPADAVAVSPGDEPDTTTHELIAV